MTFEYKRIVVAVDGSKSSERAFEKAVDIAKRNDAKMILSHVLDTKSFATVDAYDRTLADRSEVYANALLEDYKSKAKNAGINDVEINIEYGSPKIKIPKEVAKNYDADLIICGATGLNAVERFLIGSVSENITRHASCDVLVVRGGESK
ncbi:universal stress protein UspA [Aquibacillus halophilus]|uniref:Universal stress protein n=1 Tax=Aquibacillus halophilus TaxID=930132 RepID=A0A6A8DAS8_9BACI|nr:universal stress protein [Aquibacillus halophilus]MRH42853.1 universal stress protein UspA [Aquibacillus halophilus]